MLDQGLTTPSPGQWHGPLSILNRGGMLSCPACGKILVNVPCPLLAWMGFVACPDCGPPMGPIRLDIEGYEALKEKSRHRAFLAFVSSLFVGFITLLYYA